MSMKCCHCAWHNEDHMSGPGLAAGDNGGLGATQGLELPLLHPHLHAGGEGWDGDVSGEWGRLGVLGAPPISISCHRPRLPLFPCLLPLLPPHLYYFPFDASPLSRAAAEAN